MNAFSNDFLKQFYSYRRPFQEVKGYYIKHNDDGTDTLIINALGVDPADISVEVRTEYPKSQVLTVSGKTENEWGEDFSVNLYFYVRKPVVRIHKSSRAGLLSLRMEYEEPVQPKIEILEE